MELNYHGEKVDIDLDFMEGEKEPLENSVSDWEGNVLLSLGCIKDDWKNHHVRGFIKESFIEDGVLCIDAEEAWSRTNFAELLGKKFPSLKIYWIAEELGCGYLKTNDSEGKYFNDRFFVEACIGDDYMSEYFVTRDEAMKYIAEITGSPYGIDIETFNKQMQESGSDEYIYLYEFEVV